MHHSGFIAGSAALEGTAARHLGHPSAQRPRISAVFNTLNEEKRLPFALRSVRSWVHEIVVVDMQSDDGTVEIAREFGAIVEAHPRIGYADPARARAVELATGDWILILDADELVPPPLARRLIEIADAGDADVVLIPWLNYLLGGPLLHSGWGPAQDRHPRFFRRGSVTIRPEIHAYLHVSPTARILELPLKDGLAVVHFNYVDIHQFLDRLNRYTDVEAEHLIRGGGGGHARSAVRDAAREFLRRYLRQGGWRDGWRGFYLSGLMAAYRFAAHAKARERRVNGPREDIENRYQREAERWLTGPAAEPPE